MSAGGTQEEGLHLPTRWFGTEFVPFDEMDAVEESLVRLSSGRSRPLPAPLRASAERALSPPAPSRDLAVDGAALASYAAGDWSPVRAARVLLAMASAAGASDVHLEADGSGFRCRLRIAGELADFLELPAATGARLVAALKHISGCLPYRSDLVQEGRVPRQGISADVRASFMPTALGERVALRLFGRLLSLEQLGLEPALLARFQHALGQPGGLILVAGPSGGGKTTTIYAALAYLAQRRGDAHLSLEDPVEQRLRVAGIPVDQVELQPERGLDAEAALAGALRQDVDVLAVGEIRTAPEAALALKAAHTGRLVLAGLHAGSAQEAQQRMLDLGAERSVLRNTLQAVLCQRLRTLPCPDCTGPDCGRCGGTGRLREPEAELVLAQEEA